MQALNVQFLSQQNVAKTSGGIDDSIKKNESTSSFQSMLEKASKKTEVVNKENSVKNENVHSEQNNEINESEQADKTSAVAKNQENSYKTPKKEKTDAVNEDADSAVSASIAETGLEAVVVFGQEVVQANAVEEKSDIPAANGISDVASVSSDSSQTEMQIMQAFVQNDADEQIEFEKANVGNSFYDAVAAYAGDDFESEIPNVEKNPVEQEVVSQLNADTNVQEKVALQDKDNSTQSDKNKNPKLTKDTSLFTDKDGNTVISVVDERGKLAKAEAVKSEAGKSLVAESVRQTGNVLDVSMIPVNAAEQNILSSSDQAAAAVDSTFQQMLSNQIQQSAPEFVKAGNIILKDNDNGIINMNLKPEALGNVKISLHVSDKGIEGQIVVATKEAFEAFKQNMDTLRHAFQQSGFDNTELNLSFGNNSNSNGSFGQERQQSSEQFFANKVFGNFADVPESASAGSAVNVYGNSSHIDVVA